MKFLRYEYEGKTSYGILNGKTVCPVEGDIFGKFSVCETGVSLSEVKLILITSAIPFENCLSGKVFKRSGSMITFLG